MIRTMSSKSWTAIATEWGERASRYHMRVTRISFPKLSLPSMRGSILTGARNPVFIWRRFGAWSTPCTFILPRPNAANLDIPSHGAAMQVSRRNDDGRKCCIECFSAGGEAISRETSPKATQFTNLGRGQRKRRRQQDTVVFTPHDEQPWRRGIMCPPETEQGERERKPRQSVVRLPGSLRHRRTTSGHRL